MLALMNARVVAEEGGGTISGDRAFGGPGHSRGVVGGVDEGSVSDIMSGGHDGDLSQESCLFEIAVRHSARGVVGRDKPGLDLFREGFPPEVRATFRVEVDSTHAHLGGISGTQESRFLGHYLGQMGRAVTQAGGQGGKGIDVVS